VLQSVAACYSELQRDAASGYKARSRAGGCEPQKSPKEPNISAKEPNISAKRAMHMSVTTFVAGVCVCEIKTYDAVHCSGLQCIAACCSVFRCVAV